MRFYKKYIILVLLVSICWTNQEKDYSYKKDQLIAFGLSALFSGSGQFYLGDWKKGLIYSSVELFEWAYRYNYLDKNEFYVDAYKEYASDNWDFNKWVRDYYVFNDISSSVYEAFLEDTDNDNIADSYADPWKGAHGVWFEYCEDGNSDTCENGMYISTADPNTMAAAYNNICEDEERDGCDIDIDAISSYVGDVIVNHHLYEGIGKYNVYFSGWEDAVDSTSWIVIRDNNYKIATSFKKQYYEHTLRLKAKQKSDMAENALTAIFINHAVSMLDVLISKHNKKLNLKFSTYFDPNNLYGIGGIKLNVGFK